MSDLRKQRQSSAAALSDMQSSNSSLREKFGRMCRQTDRFSTEYQERYQPSKFDAVKARKHVKPGSRAVHSSKKSSQKKPKKVIEAELLPPPRTEVENKENNPSSNFQGDTFSDAPSAPSYMSSVLQSGRASTQHTDMACDSHSNNPSHHCATSSEFSEEPASELGHSVGVTKTERQSRISESTAKYIQWPLEEHIPHPGPVDHEIITNPNTTSFPCNWQSVTHEQMQATAREMALANDPSRQEISPTVLARAQASDMPGFFAWNGGAVQEEVQKKVLTFDNVHSEYRDNYKAKATEKVVHAHAPQDHEVLRYAASNGVDATDWLSTSRLLMDAAEQARVREARERDSQRSVAGLTSDCLARHSTGREGPPAAPVFFAWKDSFVPPPLPSEQQLKDSRDNVHTESRDNYIKFSAERTKKVPPPEDHIILGDDTDLSTPMMYESVTHSEMLAAQKPTEAYHSGDVSGSTSSLLKKDYRKSYAPGYFAWPVPQQFAEITAESHENVHTEYRDNYLNNSAAHTATRAPAPENHNVLGYENDIDPSVWKSTNRSQMTTADKEYSEQVAGASSAFLAKDSMNLCPPGYFAWPVVPQVAQRSRDKDAKAAHSEYADSFRGESQRRTIVPPPSDHDVIVGCLDADQSAQWRSEAQSQMDEVKQHPDEGLSLEKANRDYRRSFAPDYFAWPVKEQHAVRTPEAAANIHTEYKDSFVRDSAQGAVRASAPEDHVQIGTSPEDLDPANWKSIATLQNETCEHDYHKNGQDVVFKSQTTHSTPSFFVWPKEEPEVAKANDSRQYGYGGEICSEYDSKFVELDVHNIRRSPIKVTQTIPVNEVDPSLWQSTTKRDMETSLSAAHDVKNLRASVINKEAASEEKPMNFAWKPLPKRTKESTTQSKAKGPVNTTEHRTSFIDWNPAMHEINDRHIAAAKTSTLPPKKRRDVKFSGMSETQSRFKAWSPILPRKAVPTATAPMLKGSNASVNSTPSSAGKIDEEAKSAASASSTIDSPVPSRSTQQSGEGQLSARGGTADSAVFSADSLDPRLGDTSTIASSGKWNTSDDINAQRQTSRLGLREDITNATGARHRPRATSAPTRRRPQHTHQYSSHVNPILRNSRYPGAVAVQQQSARWSTETSSKYTWK